jgi:hypothetical protein
MIAQEKQNMKTKRQFTLIAFLATGLLAVSLSISSCGNGRLFGSLRTNSSTPEFGIGSTQISPKDDMVLMYVPAGPNHKRPRQREAVSS